MRRVIRCSRRAFAAAAELLLRPAPWGAVLALVVLLALGAFVALEVHVHEITRVKHDESGLSANQAALAIAQGEVRVAEQEIKRSRHVDALAACEEENERHQAAVRGIAALVRREAPPPASPAAAAKEKVLEAALVQIFVPHYDCAKRVKEQTKP